MAYDLYPAVDEDYDFAPVVRAALAASVELRNTVIPMTTVQRNNLTGPELWDGRLIVNLTSDLVERYDLGTTTWVNVSGVSQAVMQTYVDTNTPDVYQGTGGPPSGSSYKIGDLYCQYL